MPKGGGGRGEEGANALPPPPPLNEALVHVCVMLGTSTYLKVSSLLFIFYVLCGTAVPASFHDHKNSCIEYIVLCLKYTGQLLK